MTAVSPNTPTWPKVLARTPTEREALLKQEQERVAAKAKPAS